MINVTKAIELLAPFHNATIFSKVRCENNNRFNGQLTTGNPNYPFIGINDSMVTNEDIFEALDYHTSNNPSPLPLNLTDSIEWLNCQLI